MKDREQLLLQTANEIRYALKALPKDNKESYHKGFIEGAKSEAAKQYHQQDSEVTKGDFEELRKEFREWYINNPDVITAQSSIFDFFKPHITSQKSEWISVDDRLPYNGETVIGILKNGFVLSITYSEYHSKNWMIQGLSDYCLENPVLFWQPLPQPPNFTQQQINK